jgi:hypothetical protein
VGSWGDGRAGHPAQQCRWGRWGGVGWGNQCSLHSLVTAVEYISVSQLQGSDITSKTKEPAGQEHQALDFALQVSSLLGQLRHTLRTSGWRRAAAGIEFQAAAQTGQSLCSCLRSKHMRHLPSLTQSLLADGMQSWMCASTPHVSGRQQAAQPTQRQGVYCGAVHEPDLGCTISYDASCYPCLRFPLLTLPTWLPHCSPHLQGSTAIHAQCWLGPHHQHGRSVVLRSLLTSSSAFAASFAH